MKRRMDSGKEQLEKMLEGWRGSDRQKCEEGRRAAFESKTPDERRCRNETRRGGMGEGRGGEHGGGVCGGGRGLNLCPSLHLPSPLRRSELTDKFYSSL